MFCSDIPFFICTLFDLLQSFQSLELDPFRSDLCLINLHGRKLIVVADTHTCINIQPKLHVFG